MKWRVLWLESAEQQLAKLWDKDPDRNAITQSADLLDASLARDPYGGESRPEDKYVAFALPLGVSYEIDAAHNRVRVLSVWKVNKKSKGQ
jgi:hypothetical protein